MQYDLNIIVNCDFQCTPVQILQHVSHTACIVVSVSCIQCCLPLHHLYLVIGLVSFLDRTVEQYSKFVQTSVKYAETFVSWLLFADPAAARSPACYYLSLHSCLCGYSMKDSPSGQLQCTLNGIQLAGFVHQWIIMQYWRSWSCDPVYNTGSLPVFINKHTNLSKFQAHYLLTYLHITKAKCPTQKPNTNFMVLS